MTYDTIQGFLENLNIEVFTESDLPADYNTIWKDCYEEVQLAKILNNKVDKDIADKAIKYLSRRGHLLCMIAENFGCKNIAEVGTAEGFQFFSFAHYLSNIKDSCVYSCDIRDVRKYDYVKKYSDSENVKFVLGNSSDMSDEILKDNRNIDLFWIDGGHDNGEVVYDALRLAKTQSSNPIWIFDDFNERFGCYHDIRFLAQFFKESVMYFLCKPSGSNE